ncbi:CHAD domain-containing protein [Acidianus sulfidivorans JP7]|uniref:CHAD domain-containing protein n=1 Tax=Acidianus sulfidivorans JP7 TaxID=619593 RepID=A0A2U9ILV1_9CREN|nr:CHAD domain-containing protein [Acidianus sulfidivorans]AWR96975.1 CHAD domain-containing protein [Acidianus sulfidivorans JP7]
MKILRPEEYANDYLEKSLEISGISKEEIHDKRVYIRKYFDILYSLYPVYENPDCLFLAKETLHILGKVRDMDLCSIKNKNRDKMAYSAIKEAKKLGNCFLPKVYGSRLLVYNRLIKIYSSISYINEFHLLRKNVRIARDLVESLGYNSKDIKILAKKMGDLRDKMIITQCKGMIFPDVSISPFAIGARKAILKVIMSQEEFHHFKNVE